MLLDAVAGRREPAQAIFDPVVSRRGTPCAKHSCFLLLHDRRLVPIHILPLPCVRQGQGCPREFPPLALEENHAHPTTLFNFPIVHACRSDGLLGEHRTAGRHRRDTILNWWTAGRGWNNDQWRRTDSRHPDRGQHLGIRRDNRPSDHRSIRWHGEEWRCPRDRRHNNRGRQHQPRRRDREWRRLRDRRHNRCGRQHQAWRHNRCGRICFRWQHFPNRRGHFSRGHHRWEGRRDRRERSGRRFGIGR
jgi:hypothetical protein